LGGGEKSLRGKKGKKGAMHKGGVLGEGGLLKNRKQELQKEGDSKKKRQNISKPTILTVPFRRKVAPGRESAYERGGGNAGKTSYKKKGLPGVWSKERADGKKKRWNTGANTGTRGGNRSCGCRRGGGVFRSTSPLKIVWENQKCQGAGAGGSKGGEGTQMGSLSHDHIWLGKTPNTLNRSTKTTIQ